MFGNRGAYGANEQAFESAAAAAPKDEQLRLPAFVDQDLWGRALPDDQLKSRGSGGPEGLGDGFGTDIPGDAIRVSYGGS